MRGTADLCVAGGALLGLGAGGSSTGLLCSWDSWRWPCWWRIPGAQAPRRPRQRGGGVLAGLPLMYGAIAVGRAAAGIVPWTLAAWITWCARS